MPRRDVSDQRTAQILEAAAATLSQLGMAATRMEDIALAAGLSKGTLYLYFEGKDALLEALMHHMFEPFSAALDMLNELSQTPSNQILQYTEQVLFAFERLRPVYPVIFEFFALATRDANAQSLLNAYFRDYKDRLSVVIREGIERREFHPVDENQAAVTVIALIEGTVQLAMLNPELVNLHEQGMASIRQFVASLQVR